jgi:hypothetical protein
MEYEVATSHRGRQSLEVQQVGFNEGEVFAPARFFEKSALAGREVVVADNPMPLAKKAISEVAADESGSASDYGLQGYTLMALCEES